MKYAIFSDLSSTWPFQLIKDETRAKYTDLVRISDWVEIDFPPRTADETLSEAVALIDQKIAACRAENQQRLNVLETERANLLALPAARNNTEENVA